MNPAFALPERESALAARWAHGIAGPLRLEDGRILHIVFPGVPGGGSGPDFNGAILEAAGDLLRGDVEIHLLTSGWRAHGHERDPAFENVVLHVVGANDSSGALTAHRSGRLVPILVLPPEQVGFPEGFTPPCALATANSLASGPVLERLGLRRLRMKAARAAPVVAAAGDGQALYAALLATLGGPANREVFAALSRSLPLAALLDTLDDHPSGREMAAAAHLRAVVRGAGLSRAGLRPMASPERRLEAAGTLVARLWRHGELPGWPASLGQGSGPASLMAPGIGRALAIECMVNAVLPVALASGAWPEDAVERSLGGLPSPGVYGRLKPLERWLGSTQGSPPAFGTSARLQGGLLLHTDYCTRGRCGRCPLSE